MRYLTLEDFRTVIKQDHLLNAVRDDVSLLDDAEREALALVASKLAPFYETAKEFDRTGNDRYPLLKGWVRDLVIYNALSSIQPNQVPQLRQNRYDDVMKMLDQVQKGHMPIDLERVQTDGEPETHMRSGRMHVRDVEW